MVPTYTTFKFEQEIKGTKNAPILFLCKTDRGFESYFTKYARNEDELDGLVFELICGRLCRSLGIRTPDTALVEISEGTLPHSQLSSYQNQVYEGLITFGSCKVNNVVELSGMELVQNKYSFNRYRDPIDLLRIAIFDLWVQNRDRSEDNFNILVKQGKEREFIAIDHFDCFSDLGLKKNPYVPATLLSAKFTRKLLYYHKQNTLLSEVESFIERCYYVDIEELLDEIFSNIPDSWDVNDSLKPQLISFLCDDDRIDQIKEAVTKFITYNFSNR